MNGRSVGLLILAVVSGLGAMYGSSRMLKKPDSAPAVEMVDVVVAERDLKIEEVLKDDPKMLKVVKMPKTAVPVGAFSQIKDVEDRWVEIAMLPGEPVVDKKLAARGSPPGLISRIPHGMRAFAVEVTEKTGVSGFVLPDHRVDVVQVMPARSGTPEAQTVLQDVLVLASGTVFSRPEERAIQVRTVTLAVTPEQVDTLVAAQSRGPLSLSLRGMEDHAVVEFKKPEPPPPPVEVAIRELEPPPPPPPAPLPPVEAPPRMEPRKERIIYIHRGVSPDRSHIEEVRPKAPDEEAEKGKADKGKDEREPALPAQPAIDDKK